MCAHTAKRLDGDHCQHSNQTLDLVLICAQLCPKLSHLFLTKILRRVYYYPILRMRKLRQGKTRPLPEMPAPVQARQGWKPAVGLPSPHRPPFHGVGYGCTLITAVLRGGPTIGQRLYSHDFLCMPSLQPPTS